MKRCFGIVVLLDALGVGNYSIEKAIEFGENCDNAIK